MTTERTILLVEDNPDDEVLTLRALRTNHIANQVIVAHDGVEAIDYLHGTGPHSGRDTSLQPQLILLDLQLPRMDGLEVLRRLRAHELTRHIPTVVLTSSKQDEDVMCSYSRGANAYVRKPVDFAEFLEAVKYLGLFWLVLNEPPPPHSSLPGSGMVT
jgi:two-component system response regulator